MIVATLRRPHLLGETLENVCGLARPPDELIVVDGDAARSAEPVVRAAAGSGAVPRVQYLTSGTGLTRQRNRGLAACDGDVVVFLDDDVQVAADALARLEEAYADDPSLVGATGHVTQPRQHRVDRESRLRRLLPGGGREGTFTRFGYPRYIRRVDEPHDVEFMPGCFMSARRDAALAVGFDEAITGSGLGEDEDFSRRLSHLGRIAYVPDARVHHKLAPSHDDDSRAAARIALVNRAYLFEKNFTPTLLARLEFGVLVAMMLVHRLVNADVAAARGLLDGVAVAVREDGRRPPPGHALPVAFVGSHARSGGAERYLENLLEHVDPQWIRRVVLLEEGPSVDALRSRGTPVDVIPTGPSGASILRSSGALRRLLREAHPKVVHANGIKAALVAVLSCVGTGIPVVWVKHDFAFDGRLARFVARRCALVVGVSRAVLGALDGTGGEKLRVVNTGVRVDAGAEDGWARLEGLLPRGRAAAIVGLVGRLDPAKGHEELLAVAGELADRAPGTRFVIVGGDDPNVPGYRATLVRRIAELELEEVVTLVGQRDDVPTLIAGMDVLVVPSVASDESDRVEGFPLAALEALAVGTPVVGYATGGLPELLGDAGIVVPPRDRTALVMALECLLGDAELRSRLSAAGRGRARDRFAPERMVEGLLACYRIAAER